MRLFKQSEFKQMTPAQQQSLRQAERFLETMEPNVSKQIPNDGNWLFDMGIVRRSDGDCGSAGCILGLAKEFADLAGHPDAWRDSSNNYVPFLGDQLFFPVKVPANKFHIMGPRTAAQAVRDFIAGDNKPEFTPVDDFSDHRRGA